MGKKRTQTPGRQPQEHQFDTILGHDIQKRIGKTFLEKGTMPHALILHGPPGIGKKSFAWALAKFINCTGHSGTAMCECPACHKIKGGNYLDLSVLKPEGAARTIRIEKIRDLQDTACITPVEARRKIVIFFDAERMSVGAANSLLKILEEPPRHIVLILVTEDINKILPTIRSRCMSFRFYPMPLAEIFEWLSGLAPGSSREELQAAALLSEGRPGRALDILGGDYMKRRADMIRELEILDRYGFPALFRVADRIENSAGNLSSALNELLVWHRDLLVNCLVPDAPDLLIHSDQASLLAQKASASSFQGLWKACSLIMDRQDLANRLINSQLALMVIMTQLGKALKQ